MPDLSGAVVAAGDPLPCPCTGGFMKQSIKVPIAGATAVLLAVTATAFAVDVGAATPTEGVATAAARPMENLGRGVVAVRSSNTNVLVSWRLLGLDPDGIGF